MEGDDGPAWALDGSASAGKGTLTSLTSGLTPAGTYGPDAAAYSQFSEDDYMWKTAYS